MDLLTITHFLNGLFMIAVPILLGIFLANKFRSGWKFWWIGASTFIISQVFHLPFNSYILNPILVRLQQNIPGVEGMLFISVLLGLSAGVFETTARYAMFRRWIQEKRSWKVAIMAGAGHGGMEAIILGVLVLLTFINMVAYRNLDLSKLNLTPDQVAVASQQVQSYWNFPWYQTLLGALDRILTIPFHIAASVMVMQVFTRRPGRQQPGWLILVVFLHTLMDASAVFIANQYSSYLVELTIGILAVLDILIIFLLRKPEPEASPLEPAPITIIPTAYTVSPVEETPDNLEKTRYQ